MPSWTRRSAHGRRRSPPRSVSPTTRREERKRLMVGDVLAERYELEELVGSGGMSSVYRARDRVLDRKVALKVLHQQFISEDDYVERFRREARMVAGLLHQNIVTVIDRGEDSGCPFIVFEFVD